MQLLSVLITVLALSTTDAWAGAADGTWKGFLPGREGLRSVYFVFQSSHETLIGKMVDAHGDNPIREGRVAGLELSFSIEYDLGGQKIVRFFRGTLAEDEIHFTYQAKDGANRSQFTVRRLP